MDVEEIEFAKITLSKAIETFKSQYDLLVKIWTLLIVADITFIGYAIKEEEPLVGVVSAVFPISIFVATRIIRRTMLPVIYVAVCIEEKINSSKIDYLASTYISYLLSPKFFDKLKSISLIDDKNGRMRMLKDIKGNGYTGLSTFGFVLFITVTIVQIVLPIILHKF